MLERRLTVGPYLAIWAVLCAIQAYFAQQAINGLDAAWAGVVLVQFAKLPITIMRFNDTGRAPDDAFFALVPVGNVVLWSFCLEGKNDKRRQKRLNARAGQMGPLTALIRGMGLVGKTAGVGLPFALAYGVASGGGAWWMVRRLEWAQGMKPASLEVMTQGLMGLAGFLALYTAIQYGRRHRVSRASWVPSLFLVPTALLAGALKIMATGGGMQGSGPVLLILLFSAWNLAWMSIAGASLAIAWVVAADRAARGQPVSFGELLGEVISRTTDIAGPHGARVHAVTIGIQVIIPGIFYALQLAFVDFIAVLLPDRPALEDSANLTRSIRSRLFKMFFIWVLMSMVLVVGVQAAIDNTEAVMTSFVDPRALSLPAVIAGEVVWAITLWVLQMGLLVVFYERVGRRLRREATKREDTIPEDIWKPPADYLP